MSLSKLKSHLPKLPHLKANIWLTAIITVLSLFLLSTIVYSLNPQVSYNASSAGSLADDLCRDSRDPEFHWSEFCLNARGDNKAFYGGGGSGATQGGTGKSGATKSDGRGGGGTAETALQKCQKLMEEIQKLNDKIPLNLDITKLSGEELDAFFNVKHQIVNLMYDFAANGCEAIIEGRSVQDLTKQECDKIAKQFADLIVTQVGNIDLLYETYVQYEFEIDEMGRVASRIDSVLSHTQGLTYAEATKLAFYYNTIGPLPPVGKLVPAADMAEYRSFLSRLGTLYYEHIPAIGAALESFNDHLAIVKLLNEKMDILAKTIDLDLLDSYFDQYNEGRCTRYAKYEILPELQKILDMGKMLHFLKLSG